MSKLEYTVMIAPLPPEEGGGYLARVVELPGCLSDGETPEEAVRNVQDAILAWLEGAREMGIEIPTPLGSEKLRELAVA